VPGLVDLAGVLGDAFEASFLLSSKIEGDGLCGVKDLVVEGLLGAGLGRTAGLDEGGV